MTVSMSSDEMPAPTLRSVYVHGRPAPHPNRLRLLPAIGAQLLPADFRIPWQHLTSPSPLRKALSLTVCSLTFPRRSSWDLFLGDGPQHLPVVMKTLALLGPRQKVVPYLANEFPYFLANGIYGPTRTAILRWWFSRWDAYLCLGPMTVRLVRQLLPAQRQGDIFEIRNFVRATRAEELRRLDPPLEGQHLLFIGHGPGGFRVLYKGLDLLLSSLAVTRKARPSLTCTVAGEWKPAETRRLEKASELPHGAVTWKQAVTEIAPLLEKSALYVHCGRGDAWPNAVMEAMVAGVPPLVSEWTGGSEYVARVHPRLVVPLRAEAFAASIEWYLRLPASQRRNLGAQARSIALSDLTEDGAVCAFRATMTSMLRHMGIDRSLPESPAESTHRVSLSDPSSEEAVR